MEVLGSHLVHGGRLQFVRHASRATRSAMTLSVFVPPGEGPFPVVYWLSGLACTANNFTEKAGAYRAAAGLGLIVVVPDTSPRGEDVADDDAYDLGQGAGFYLDATEAPWAERFQMESYVADELASGIETELPASGRRSIFGHSMGGHGALTLAMRHPGLYRSVSAFAPIGAAASCPWGRKAFTAYLGANQTTWAEHDASLLMATGKAAAFDEILIDQGLADTFLAEQLQPEKLLSAAATGGATLRLRSHPGYDHGYYFVQSFIDDHLSFHAHRLGVR